MINEAMSFGLPIVSSSMAGASYDLMVDGKNGFMFESENIEDLTSKLELLINKEDKRVEFSKNSKQIIKEYSIDSMVNRHISIFNRIVRNY